MDVGGQRSPLGVTRVLLGGSRLPWGSVGTPGEGLGCPPGQQEGLEGLRKAVVLLGGVLQWGGGGGRVLTEG